MKAITIRQPWASLIMIGAKPYEYRSWRTNIRGRVAIHAAAGMGKDERAALRSPTYRKALTAAGLDPDDLPRACVLGTVSIAECIDNRPNSGFAWDMRAPRAFAKPAPAKGRLGFWEWSGWDRAMYLECAIETPPAKTIVHAGQWLVVANASGGMSGDRGDLVAVCENEEDAWTAGRRSGYHRRTLSYGIAGKIRTPRGCDVEYDEASS